MSKAYFLLFSLGVMVLLITPSPSLAYNGPPEEDKPFPERKPPMIPGNNEPPKFIPGGEPLPPKKEEPPVRPGDKPVPQRLLSENDGVENSSCGCQRLGKPKCKGMAPPNDVDHSLAEEVLEKKEVFQPPRKLRAPMPTYNGPPYGPPREPPYGPPPHEPPYEPPYGPPPHEPPYQPPPHQPPYGPPPREPPYHPPPAHNN